MSFALLRLMPGSPFDDDNRMHPLVREKLEASWGLHENLFFQFGLYAKSVVQMELGYSLQNPSESVAGLIGQRFSHTWKLNLMACLCVLGMSVVLASCFHFCEKTRSTISLFHYLVFSLPILFLAPMCLFIFSFYFEWLPFAFLESKSSYILPVAILSLRPIAILSQIQIRAQEEIMKQNFIQALRAKGLSHLRIYFVHIQKLTVPLALAYLPEILIGLVSGSFLIEVLFSIPGVGLLFVESINDRDYPMIVGITLIFGFGFIFLSQFVQYLGQTLDPRTRVETK